MPSVRHPRHAMGLWALVIAMGFALVGGCDSSSDQPAATEKSETTTKAQNNMADFMKTKPKGTSAKK